MKMINPSDRRLEEAFARHVAKWRKRENEDDEEITEWYDKKNKLVSHGDKFGNLPNWIGSVNAVMPWLDKNLVFIQKEDGQWSVGVDAWTTIHYGKSRSLPRAAVIALLRAEGVEVEFRK